MCILGVKKIKKVRDFGTFEGLFVKKTKKVAKSAQKAIRRADSQGVGHPPKTWFLVGWPLFK